MLGVPPLAASLASQGIERKVSCFRYIKCPPRGRRKCRLSSSGVATAHSPGGGWSRQEPAAAICSEYERYLAPCEAVVYLEYGGI